MGILIDKIYIKNFRSLQEVEIVLSPFTLLVGSNNAGKTSFLRALNIALSNKNKVICNKSQDLFRSQNGNYATDEEGEHSITIDLHIIPYNYETQKRLQQFEDDWLIFGDSAYQQKGDESFVAFRRKIIFNESADMPEEVKTNIIEDWETKSISEDNFRVPNELLYYFIDAQRDILADIRTKRSYFGLLANQLDINPQDLANIQTQIDSLNSATANASPALSFLKDKLQNLNRTIQTTNGNGIEITPFPKRIDDIHKEMKMYYGENNADSFEIENHGMGTRSWASLLSFKAFIDWLQEENNPNRKEIFHPIIAVEEPEAHLHPNAQRVLYQQLKSTAKQQIVSTHSPYLAAQADLTEIRHFYKQGEKTVVNKIQLTGIDAESLRKIRREIIETRGELLFAKAVILFEGETEEQAIPIWADAYFQEEYGVSYFELGINFLGVGGGGKFRPYVQIFNELNINWFILSDYDKQDIKRYIDKIVQDFTQHTGNIITHPLIVILGKDFEDYLIEEGYTHEWELAINEAENSADYLGYYIAQNQGNIKKREKTSSPPCNTCHQPIFRDILFDYQQTDGRALALRDCLHKGKTKYGAKIADKILENGDNNRRFPTKVKELFQKAANILQLAP